MKCPCAMGRPQKGTATVFVPLVTLKVPGGGYRVRLDFNWGATAHLVSQ